jgi:pimeloyl-ACP methyl ester carboxylesterase
MGESGFVDVEGGRIYYEAEGDGPPVLLIHGGLGTLRMWDEHVARFAARHRVIRYDTRGFGRTETDDVEFANRDDAIAVLDHLGVGSAVVVGQSRGAMIALDLALDRADRVDALVSVAGGIGGYEPELADGTSQPPWDELERLWMKKDWPRSRSSRPRSGSTAGDSR